MLWIIPFMLTGYIIQQGYAEQIHNSINDNK